MCGSMWLVFLVFAWSREFAEVLALLRSAVGERGGASRLPRDAVLDAAFPRPFLFPEKCNVWKGVHLCDPDRLLSSGDVKGLDEALNAAWATKPGDSIQ